MGEKMIIRLFGFLCLFMFAGSVSHAEVTGDDAFTALKWELVYDDEVTGVVQSICATEDYIITIENISDSPTDSDIVSAYYRNNVDEDGNPVQQYGLAKRAADTCWEHGNGMAYNPNTHEIYVALYTNSIPENRGCLYVMDPDTLAYKRTIKVSDDYNLLGIDYKEDTNQYVIQTNVDGGYSFKILDENFQVVEELGEYASAGMGNNFQDLAVEGDYILNFPLTLGMGIGDYLHVYSISRRALVAAPQIDFRFENVTADEPESLCEIEPGVYLSAINVVEADGAKKIRFYKVEIPYYLYVNITDAAGEKTTQRVLRGEDLMVDTRAGEGYQLSSLMVNGRNLLEFSDREEFENGYLLQNIREDKNIEISFGKAGFFAFPLEISKDILSSEKSVFIVSLVIGIVCAGSIVIVIYMYYLHVKMERKRKALRARRKRQQYASNVRVVAVSLTGAGK
ncbi:MAG: hypothetical protein HFG95_11685 [Dorea sp.]|nr:hypothetical protein [Dorea sp.]